MSEPDKGRLDLYGDESIATFDQKVPLWLKLTYIIMPIWGVVWFYLYWY
jgi:hypothetical protein